MKKRNKRGYLITAAIGLLIAAGVTAIQGGFSSEVQQQIYSAFCDGFFVSGALITGAGLLVFVAGDGMFDMMNYGVGKVLRLILSQKKQDAFPKTFMDYREMKTASRKGGSGFIVITGMVFIAFSVVFLLLYI